MPFFHSVVIFSLDIAFLRDTRNLDVGNLINQYILQNFGYPIGTYYITPFKAGSEANNKEVNQLVFVKSSQSTTFSGDALMWMTPSFKAFKEFQYNKLVLTSKFFRKMVMPYIPNLKNSFSVGSY